jgi:hypothetical protein
MFGNRAQTTQRFESHDVFFSKTTIHPINQQHGTNFEEPKPKQEQEQEQEQEEHEHEEGA